jgi:hypothetical protein
VIIHEFLTENLDAAKLQTNSADFQAFVGILFDVAPEKVVTGRMYGPVVLAKTERLPRSIELFMGKAVCDWSAGQVSA